MTRINMNIGRTSYRVYSMIKDKSIFIKNIYWMLAYAFTVLQHREYEYVAKEEFVNIHSLFAAILAGGISRQLKQGLYREYVNHKENVLNNSELGDIIY
jgi:5-methylcytosine-specific restriction enzyme subunit McrC